MMLYGTSYYFNPLKKYKSNWSNGCFFAYLHIMGANYLVDLKLNLGFVTDLDQIIRHVLNRVCHSRR